MPDDSNKISKAIPIDANGKCHIAELVAAKSDKNDSDDEHQDEQQDKNKKPEPQMLKVVSAEFYFHKPITVHLELYLFYCFIHFFIVHRSVLTAGNLIKVKAQQSFKKFHL